MNDVRADERPSSLDLDELRELRRRVDRADARGRILAFGAIAAAAVAIVLYAPAALSDPSAPVATIYDDLYYFAANTPAVASEVNSNFATLHGLADDNAADIAGHDVDIAALGTGKLDKAGGAISGDLAVGGRLAVGVRLKTCGNQTSGVHQDCSCNPNEVVLGGGAWNGHTNAAVLRESRPLNTRTWRVACKRLLGNGATAENAFCLGTTVICARLQ